MRTEKRKKKGGGKRQSGTGSLKGLGVKQVGKKTRLANSTIVLGVIALGRGRAGGVELA